MHRLRGLWLSVVCAASTACVTSVQPYVADDSARFSPELIGRWVDAANGERAIVTQTGPRRYGIAYTDDRGETKWFIGRLGRLGSRDMLDLEAAETDSAEGSAGAHLAIFLDTVGPRIQISVLETDTLAAYLHAHSSAIGHRRTKDGLVLTAGTADLVKFLAVYLRRQRVLGEPASWVRERP